MYVYKILKIKKQIIVRKKCTYCC